MKRVVPVMNIVFALSIAPAFAADAPVTVRATPAATAQKNEVPLIDAASVARLLAAGKLQAFDANGAATRQKNGIVPGARLLSHYENYDPAAVLPADKAATLVFYCYNDHCRAADGAAEKAKRAGYSDVRIMREGIEGWKKAGHAVTKVAPL